MLYIEIIVLGYREFAAVCMFGESVFSGRWLLYCPDEGLGWLISLSLSPLTHQSPLHSPSQSSTSLSASYPMEFVQVCNIFFI